jgi:anaerobic ribonucleoside-triphosphate reductase activating protein
MLRFHNYDIVFREIPGETTLAINLTNCPHRCKGCHSPHLREDKGTALTQSILKDLLERYGAAITCICFMGGDAEPQEVEQFMAFLRKVPQQNIKTAWYSGRERLYPGCNLEYYDYIKLGPYVEHLGAIDSLTTNQRLFRIERGKMVDMTTHLRRKTSAADRNLTSAHSQR